MIKYNNNTIYDWNFDTSNLIKVYRNNAIVFYKVSGESPTPEWKVCFAVVDDISEYTDREFEDVYDNATEKWYKLNNLNQYEEYGVYASGRTSCEGSTSRLPQGYTEVEYIENTGTSTSNGAYLNLGLPLYDAIGNSFQITSRLKSEYYSASGYDDLETIINSEGVSSPYYGFVYRYAHSTHNIELAANPSNHATLSTTANTDGTTSLTISCNSTSVTDQVPLGLFASYNANYNTPYRFAKATIYSFTVVKNGTTVRDLVPAKRDSDSVYGLYDLINDVFYTSPNGNNFIGGDPVTPTDCVTTYEGKLTIDNGYEYQYSGGSWINVGEVSGSTATLPNVPFTVNYNAKNYDSQTKTLLKTEGQLANVDAVITAGTPTVNDGYITIASDTRATISGYQTYFNRTNSAPNLTIISKQRTDDSNCHMFSNRDSNYNWMYRPYSTKLTIHGSSETGQLSVTTQPVIESARVDSSRNVKYNNYTNNTTSTTSSFSYGSTNSGKFALFAGYAQTRGEWFVGDFYWVYMSQSTLTDEQVQQVIDYNEGSGEPEYPIYYDEIQDPPDNLVFSSMAEAESYECPWVGMHATIDGDKYIFSGDSQSGYEWVYNSSRLPSGYTEVEYVQNTGTSYFNTNFVPNQDTRVVCDMQLVTASDFPHLWGAGAWNSASGLLINYGRGYFQMSWLGETAWTKYTSVPTSFDRKVYDVNKNYLYVDSVKIGLNTYTTRTASDPIGVFTYISSGRPSSSSYWGKEHFKGKMYSFQIYDNGTLVRDLVPCIRDNDDTVGAYDIVNDVFYTVPTGYTTDKLIAGNPI